MKVVVVHRSARDAYQVALALQDAGMLDRLFTDLYWRADSRAAKLASHVLPARVTDALTKRHCEDLRSRNVETLSIGGLWSFLLEKSPAPFGWKKTAMRRTDSELGRLAGIRASRRGSALLSYSYYAHTAFQNLPAMNPRILFQLHPHPVSVRRILAREMEAHPDCAQSLEREWELSLPPAEFDSLSGEARQAGHCICASTFTRQTLVENGVDEKSVHVVPYGVHLDRFSPANEGRSTKAPLRLLFVGTISQRKGIKYLLDALRLVGTKGLEVQVCGRVVDDLKMFREWEGCVRVTPSVSHNDLLSAYRRADLFVFPSLAEGFGHVLLESLACGLPVLSTTRTAAPDLITEGESGFVVAPGDAAVLASRIEWALSNRTRLGAMRRDARQCAEQFSWERFRKRIAQVVSRCVESQRPPRREERLQEAHMTSREAWL